MAYEASLKILKKDTRFDALIKKHKLEKLGRGMKPFESLVRSIIYQQVSGKAAASIYAKFKAIYGIPVPKDPDDWSKASKKFPTPEQILATPIDTLRSAGLSGQKASYIKDLAEKFSDGTIRHAQLHKMTNEDIIEHVTQVKGIGVWTAQMFLIFTLERLNVLPTGDLGVQKGFQILYGLKKLPTHAQMEKLAKDWRDHASVASWYLWRLADEAKPVKKIVKKKKQSGKF
jgi:DNA-3-methyladenine glycosylase II